VESSLELSTTIKTSSAGAAQISRSDGRTLTKGINMKVSTNKRSAITANTLPVVPGRSPTEWWRGIAAPNFHVMALSAMRASIEKIEMLGEPRWRDAVAGDAAAAVGIALHLDHKRASPGKLDLVMTALVINARGGNATACVVLSNIIRRLPGAGKREARIATSWLMQAFRPVADRISSRG
jgi:hypothetical protein